MNIRGKTLPTLFATLLLAACSGGMSGTYEGAYGMVTLAFHGSKVDITVMNQTHELSYSTDGDKIILESPQGKLVVPRNKDGSLDTPWGTLKRKD